MPRVDFESLVSVRGGGGDRKIGCCSGGGENRPVEKGLSGDDDVPPDSICLPKDAEFDWYDRNAVYQRKGSTRSNSNPKSKPSSAAVGFPSRRPQKPNLFSVDAASSILIRRIHNPSPRPPTITASGGDARFLRNRSVPWDPRSVFPTASEPSSPNVSCIGRVRSSRKDCRHRRHWSSEPQPKHKADGAQGFWTNVAALFLSGCRDLSHVPAAHERWRALPIRPPPELPRRSVTAAASAAIPAQAEIVVAPGLGAAKRFASGRRSSGSEAADLGLP